ncbi:DUF2268 domain-containing protein [Salibacterium salarium]|uniref:DUF2268 domain-containing protein n=1 Tax=Salibacterium salarium TaxID=284579 RepID=UPI001FEB6CA8|nr:DUF2268 domain-containing putative Zn-dependent protease [Salibacterium salarium]
MKVVEQEYKRLKKKWNGPESFIYIFPIKHVHLPDRKRAIQKNGVSFKEGIFLFLSPDIPLVEIKALLAHEYNHVCRLAYLKLDEKNIPLKESLIIEGLGEYAVKELYGEERLGPWTRLYQNKNVIGIWERGFLPDLNVKGLDKHSLFLYGQGNDKFPKWIGYYFGFQIVESYDERYGPLCIRELLTKTADELIAGSNLPLE